MGFKEEFKLSKFKLSHERAADFAVSPWLPWPVLAAYRGIIAAYCIGWIIYSGFYPGNGQEKWFIYLTNWGYSFVTIYFILSFTVTLNYHLKEKRSFNLDPVEMTSTDANANTKPVSEINDEDIIIPVKGHHSAMWAIFGTGANPATTVTLLYWSLLAVDYTGVALGLDVSTHALNSVTMLLDLALCSMPIRILHMVYPMIFAMAYGIFVVVYWALGGTNTYNMPYIYPVNDFNNNLGLAVGFVLGFAFLAPPLVQLFHYGVYRLREVLALRYGRTRKRVDTNSSSL